MRKFENVGKVDLGSLIDILINNGKRIVVSEHYPKKLIRTYDVFILGDIEEADKPKKAEFLYDYKGKNEIKVKINEDSIK